VPTSDDLYELPRFQEPFRHPEANCRDAGPGPFFLDQGDRDLAPRARALCSTCPAQRACLVHALVHGEEEGIWGGTTDRQRRTVRQAVAGAGRDPVAVGGALDDLGLWGLVEVEGYVRLAARLAGLDSTMEAA